ncbi:MAG: HD-GYP domain-containing protein [Clostridia bacterium]|nr:HD-GYP domain-containing protein [Clostridia bacterium]
MRKMPVQFLQPGMRVGRAIYSADGRVLLNAGVVLRPRFIEALKDLGISSIYIEDKDLEGVEIVEAISESTRLEATKMVRDLMEGVKNGYPVIIEAERVNRVIGNMIDELLKQHDLIVDLADIRVTDEYTFGHSVNVCVLSLLTGITLNYSRSNLEQLGMGAILHDLGKTRVPEHILNKPGPLTPEEFSEIKKHTIDGFTLLSEQNLPPSTARVALEHHERYNGGGYPQGLKGTEIHDYARVVGIADVYDALTTDRVYRKAYPPNEAYELIAGSGNHAYDYQIVTAFLSNVAAYPVGTYVQLNTGEIGIVTGTPRKKSQRPNVRILYDPCGQRMRHPHEVALAEELSLSITQVIPPEKLPLPQS